MVHRRWRSKNDFDLTGFLFMWYFHHFSWYFMMNWHDFAFIFVFIFRSKFSFYLPNLNKSCPFRWIEEPFKRTRRNFFFLEHTFDGVGFHKIWCWIDLDWIDSCPEVLCELVVLIRWWYTWWRCNMLCWIHKIQDVRNKIINY